ncbi:type I restriction enzyme M protein [Mucilaginibacter gossypiicola]|uniref:Type I restriction enzyme M protein n=1 Tax=Mucilaginibacter gossypiicola TaxID=551995 RepID=A0A1H8MNH5_9SPHI|nr:restriction endonuclease subunit S [Mucilaginibacter gossypiicola]SEO18972.1 type I restriction enzyme M protein [Mucilaginibacter gossypiicola]
MPDKSFLQNLGFNAKENTSGIYHKKYDRCDGYCIEVDFENEKFNYGELILSDSKTTLNFSQTENWVVLECVDRLLEKGYKPANIKLEKIYPAGHGHSGRLDICVTRDNSSEYLLIECKTFGKEFDNAVKKLNKDGGQLFTYFKFSNKADILMLYASELKGGSIRYKNEIVKIEDDYRTGDVKDFFEKWNKLTKDNGVFESWANVYNFESKALTINDLDEIKQEDSSFIFNRFLEILRHNVVSDKGNAFNRIFTLFLCKIYDEKINEGTDNELGFQWLEGVDDHRSFQIRLTDLYKNGMHEFLEKVVTDFSETEFNNKFKHLDDGLRNSILGEFQKIRLEKNNEFAIKDVYDEQSFNENAIVVKEIVQLLEKYKLRYTKKQQYLSDFFELLLTTGLKQESGQFFTPVPVAQFVIKSLPIDTILEEKLSSAKIDNDTLLPYVIDNAAGSGHFLTETMHEMQRLIKLKVDKKYNPSVAKKIRNWQDDHFAWAMQYVYGIEKDYRLVKVGKVGCYLHGDGLANVIHSDGLARFGHHDYKGKLLSTDKDFPQENKQFDILVSNPPYSVSAFKNAARSFYKENDFELYNRLTDNSSEIECLFIERTKQLLKDGGVAGVILPSSILSNSGIYSKSRELILEYFDIVGITELGSNTFMATGTNTVILFLRRRNNYVSINLKKAVEKFFTTFSDVTTNGIEKPVAKYVNYVWENVSYDDYVTLLQKNPNKAITEHEIYIEYKKKLKVKNEKEFWSLLLDKEADKLFYFILAYPQKVVLVRSGEKDAEKRFLGYEFSNRRGSEGIHPMQRGKSIEECTQLFDSEIFDNPQKASTYIYKAFQDDFDFPIDETMQGNVSRHNLVNMLTFDKVDFEKNISLSVKKKANPIISTNSRYPVKTLQDVAEFKRGPFGGSLKKEIFVDSGYKIYEQQHAIKNDFTLGRYFIDEEKFNEMKSFELLPNDIIMSCSGTIGKVAVFPSDAKRGIINQALLRLRPLGNISTPFLKILLENITNNFIENSHGAGLQNVASVSILKDIKIPLPPKDVQEKIVAEILHLEELKKVTTQENERLNLEIKSIYAHAKSLFESRVLSNEINIIGGGTPNTNNPKYWNGNIPWLSIADFKNISRYVTITEKNITHEGLKNSSAKYLDESDIIISARGTVGAVAQLTKPMTFNQSCYGIKVKENLLSDYLFFALKFEIEQFKNNAYGAIFDSITTKTFDLIEIPLPPLAEQQKIVDEIEIIESKINKLREEIAVIPQKVEAVLNSYLN